MMGKYHTHPIQECDLCKREYRSETKMIEFEELGAKKKTRILACPYCDLKQDRPPKQ